MCQFVSSVAAFFYRINWGPTVMLRYCLLSFFFSNTLNSQYGVRSRAGSFLFENDKIETKMLTKEARIRRNIIVDPEVMFRVGQLG